jgi:hypothetical protein
VHRSWEAVRRRKAEEGIPVAAGKAWAVAVRAALARGLVR